jgi:DNA-binding HxlR family transcriptional regulator
MYLRFVESEMTKGPFSCGLEAALSVIGGKWKFMILFHIGFEQRRYGELKRLMPGISEKMLIQSLKQMERDGIIDRHDFKQVPPHVEYSATMFGQSLARAVAPLCEWGTVNMNRLVSLAAENAAAKGSIRSD